MSRSPIGISCFLGCEDVMVLVKDESALQSDDQNIGPIEKKDIASQSAQGNGHSRELNTQSPSKQE